MENLISKLLVLIREETKRFGNNKRPTRVFTDCSIPETGAFCHVYNHMTLEAYINLRLRQVLMGQPCINPVDSQLLLELIWCHTHVQHAKADWPKKKLTGKVTNELKNLLSQYLVAFGHLLTHVKDFIRLIQWLKVFYALLNLPNLPLPGSDPTPLTALDVMAVGTDEKLPKMEPGIASRLTAKELLQWNFEGQGTLPLSTLVGAPRASVFPSASAPSLSPLEAIDRFGPLVTIAPVSSSGPKPVFEFSMPLLGLAVRVPGDPSTGLLKNPLYNPAVSSYFDRQWVSHIVLWCQGTFCTESRFNGNIHSEIAINVQKNLDLGGVQNLSVRRFVEQILIATKAAIVRLCMLVTAVLSGPAPRKKHNRQLVEGLFESVPEPENSDEEDKRPGSIPRKRTPAEATQLKLALEFLSATPAPNQIQTFSLRPSQRKEIHKRCRELAAGREFKKQLYKPVAETVDRASGVMRLSWILLSDRALFPGSPRVRAGTLLAAATGIEKALSPDKRSSEAELQAALREMEDVEVRSPERTPGIRKEPGPRKSPGLQRAQNLINSLVSTLPASNPPPPLSTSAPPPATSSSPGNWLLRQPQPQGTGLQGLYSGFEDAVRNFSASVPLGRVSTSGEGIPLPPVAAAHARGPQPFPGGVQVQPVGGGGARSAGDGWQQQLPGVFQPDSSRVLRMPAPGGSLQRPFRGGIPLPPGAAAHARGPQQVAGDLLVQAVAVREASPGNSWQRTAGIRSEGSRPGQSEGSRPVLLPSWLAGLGETRRAPGTNGRQQLLPGGFQLLGGITQPSFVHPMLASGAGGSLSQQVSSGQAAETGGSLAQVGSGRAGRGKANRGRGQADRGRGRGRAKATSLPAVSIPEKSFTAIQSPANAFGMSLTAPSIAAPPIAAASASPPQKPNQDVTGPFEGPSPCLDQPRSLETMAEVGGSPIRSQVQSEGQSKVSQEPVGSKGGAADAGAGASAGPGSDKLDKGPVKRQKRLPALPGWEDSEEEAGSDEAPDSGSADDVQSAGISGQGGVPFIDVDDLEVCSAEPEEQPPTEEGTTRLIDPGVESWNRPSKGSRARALKRMKPLFTDSWNP